MGGYPEGVVSKHLCSLKAGDSIEVKGPFEKLAYKANMKKEIGMVAGGSGITPMLQILKEAFKTQRIRPSLCSSTATKLQMTSCCAKSSTPWLLHQMAAWKSI